LHLVSDIEVLRKHLQIPKWHMVFGGSWGSTLALLYAQTHPEVVGSLVLRGIFTLRKIELDWFFKGGIGEFYPEHYDAFIDYLPEDKRDDPLSAYYSLITSPDHEIRLSASRVWSATELCAEEDPSELLENDEWVLRHSSLGVHYIKHGAWMEDGQLLRKGNIDRIRHIPSRSRI
jgi:proline iminopeptidase